MQFLNPSETSHIPTYRVMDSDGVLVDKDRKPLNLSNEEILTWYKNMLSGSWYLCLFIANLTLIFLSECDGRGYVRGAKTRPDKLLHGKPTLKFENL